MTECGRYVKKKQNILKQKQSQNVIFPINLAAEYNIKLLQQQQKAEQRNEDPKKLLKVLEQVQQSQQKIIQEEVQPCITIRDKFQQQQYYHQQLKKIKEVIFPNLKLQSLRKKVSLIKHPQNYQAQNEIKQNMSLESKKKELLTLDKRKQITRSISKLKRIILPSIINYMNRTHIDLARRL